MKLFSINLTEHKNIEEYKTLNALFTRELVVPREYSDDDDIFISPADSKLLEIAKIQEGALYQVKGNDYGVDELLGFETHGTLEGFTFLNFYLSPTDYHRFHAPCDIIVKRTLYIPGSLYPVNAPSLQKWPKLFSKNERVVLEGETNNGKKIFLIFVGALNVGKIAIKYEENINTNSCKEDVEVYEYAHLKLKKGDEIGYFKMGSSIVMICEEFSGILTPPCKVRFGESIGKRKGAE